MPRRLPRLPLKEDGREGVKMNIDKQVREVLNAYHRGRSFMYPNDRMTEDQAFFQIHSLYMEEFEKILPDMFPFSDVNFEENNYEAGYNACLAKIRAKLKV